MTTAEIARSFRARKIGRGKWMAKCPSHREKTGSLSITDMGDGRTRLHCFAGCSQADVLRSAGMTWKDLRPGDVSSEIRQRMTLEERKEALERQLGLVIWLGTLEKGKRPYWRKAYRRIRRELDEIRCWLEPEKVVQEWQDRQFQKRVRRVGWNGIWQEFWRQYGVDGTRTGVESGTEGARQERFHRGPHQLSPGWVQARRGDDIGHREHLGAGD